MSQLILPTCDVLRQNNPERLGSSTHLHTLGFLLVRLLLRSLGRHDAQRPERLARVGDSALLNDVVERGRRNTTLVELLHHPAPVRLLVVFLAFDLLSLRLLRLGGVELGVVSVGAEGGAVSWVRVWEQVPPTPPRKTQRTSSWEASGSLGSRTVRRAQVVCDLFPRGTRGERPTGTLRRRRETARPLPSCASRRTRRTYAPSRWSRQTPRWKTFLANLGGLPNSSLVPRWSSINVPPRVFQSCTPMVFH